MPFKFDARRLITDLGGVEKMARERHFNRATLYRWLAGADVSGKSLCKLKEVYRINVDRYFREYKE